MTGDNPPTPLSRYELKEPLGQGGLATVYRARDTLLDRDVAVKVFDAAADDAESLRRQEDEARRAASLAHPALARLYDVGTRRVGGRTQIHLVMEYVRGGDLAARIEQAPLHPRDVARVAHDAANGLRYIHQEGLLHRDLKPQNILVQEAAGQGHLRAKITDFGIASVIGADPGQGTSHGTPAYLAPEQIEGADPSEASDTYALGLVLIEALSGELEFPGSREVSALARLQRDPVIPLGTPAPLAAVLRGLTHRDPAQRMRLSDAVEALEGVLAEFVESTRPDGPDEEERARVEAVRRFGVSNAEPDEAIDRIRDLARRIFDSAIALVAIVEGDRAWIKSGTNTAHAYVDREFSPCALAVDRRALIAVGDVDADEWSRANPVMASLGVRSWASAPLWTSDGYVIGGLCIADTRTHDFTSRQLEDLQDLAAILMRELELRLAARRAVFDT